MICKNNTYVRFKLNKQKHASAEDDLLVLNQVTVAIEIRTVNASSGITILKPTNWRVVADGLAFSSLEISAVELAVASTSHFTHNPKPSTAKALQRMGDDKNTNHRKPAKK